MHTHFHIEHTICQHKEYKFIFRITQGKVWWSKPVVQVTWEAEIRRITVQDQPGQKGSQDPILIDGWVQWCMPVISNEAGSVNRMTVVQALNPPQK
jgi:hypothetical protein